MRIDIRPIFSKIGAKLKYKGEESFKANDFSLSGPVRYQLMATNLDRRILVEGKVSGTAILSCVSCLSEFPFPFQVSISEEFVPFSLVDRKYRKIAALEELSIFTYEEDAKSLDLSEAVRQAILLQLPTRPICKPACRGLCLKCGKNRNEGDCRCSIETIPSKDNSWILLEEMKKQFPLPGEKKGKN